MIRPVSFASRLPATAARLARNTVVAGRYTCIGAVAAVVALSGCNTDRPMAPVGSASLSASSADAREESAPEFSGSGANASGVVYTLSNQTAGNAVLVLRRAADGSLSPNGVVASGGTGTGAGAGLGSQNALVLSRDGKLLFAVNACSNAVSSFAVAANTLTIVSTVSSGGARPISLTAVGGLLYVVNTGGAGNISGLRFNSRGVLTPIANSSRALSSSKSAPAQIEFSPDGDRLIVTEKATNLIASYNVGENGLASVGTFTASSGATPFGFGFQDRLLVVSEAFGGAANSSAASSYELGRRGTVSLVSGSVPTTQTAACWVAVLGNGRFAYVTNAGSGTVTGYAIREHGELQRLDANGETAALGSTSAPTDMALSRGDRFLYALTGGTGTIGVMRVQRNGSLRVLTGGASGLPAGTAGHAAQ